MSPEQGDSGGTIRLQLGDGRWTTLRLEPEEWQLYYGGARRDEASELAERAELAKLIGLQPGPAGPIREPKAKEDGEATTRIYLQGAHLYVGTEEAREAAADEPDKLKVELDAVEKAIKADPAVLRDAGTDALQAAARIAVVEDMHEQRERETIEIQDEFLRQYADLYKLNVVAEYRDEGISGTVPLHERPAGTRLLEDAKAGNFDVLLVYKLDRLGRSLLVIVEAHDLLAGSGAGVA
jgi:hypothetical protein